MDSSATPATTNNRIADSYRRARSLQAALRAVRIETPGWVLDDALLEALDLLAGQVAIELAIVERDQAA